MREYYQQSVVPQLGEQLGITNLMRIPKVSKVTLNMGVGGGDRKVVEKAAADLSLIAGQAAVITQARRSVASFKIREGFPVGCKVTLRGSRMYDFLARLVHVAIPRVRDFRGLAPRSMDGRGSFSMGIREHIIFPEIDYDSVEGMRGLDICITTTARTDDEGLSLLRTMQFPFITD